MVIIRKKKKLLLSGFFFLFLFINTTNAQAVDQELLEKYIIDIVFREKFQNNSFYFESCDFCDEFKIELFKAGINVSEEVNENQYKIIVNFNRLSKGLKVIRGWNGKIISPKGITLGVFNVEKKKIVVNTRADYVDRKNCMLFIAKEIFKNI